MFAELLARSNFSFLRGASHPEELVERAHELDLDAIGICDRDGLYGSARAFVQGRETQQRVVVGAELSLVPPDRRVPRDGKTFWRDEAPAEPYVLALLVADHDGYSSLCRLLTLSHEGLPKGESAIEIERVVEHARGLWAAVLLPDSTAGLSAPVPERLLACLRDGFGERVHVAAHRRLDGCDAERTALAEAWSRRFGLHVFASARPTYHGRARKPLADVVHCIREGTTLDGAGTALSPNAEAFLRSELEMQKLFRDRPAWVERAGEIAGALRFSLGELRYRFPCEITPGEDADTALGRLVGEGERRRWPAGTPPGVKAQLEKELALIAKLAVAPYFLSTWEVVEMARRRKILCQGRGSAANSAVCYALGITAVDPARSSLLFERFMSAERSEPPDIDVDFEHERREEVIQEIYQRWGRDRAAMVSEVIAYRGKSALREVGKVFGLSLEQVDRLSAAITHWDSAEVSDRRLQESGFDTGDDRLRQVVMLARALEGFPRHLSIHVGGFVISAEPLWHVAPIEPARMPDRTVMPWDKDDIEALGFFKIDVLGLGMLTAVRKALELVHADGGLPAFPPSCALSLEPFDPLEVVTRIPPEDPAVYESVSRADTVGVFQIESRAQMAMLPRLRPKCFYDLVIEVAIVRPGPIQGGMVHPYLRRRNGEEKVRSPHPDLWPILERTLGVPLFQEQVMQISIVGAGYSGGEADQLRRDMAAWKKSGRLLRHRQRLLDGFAEKGISQKFGEALFEQIKGFGDYGFPESHAASFALIVYSSAWLKTHHPAEFACALVNAQPMGFYSVSTILRDAQKHGVEVRDVCVVRSEWDCTLERSEEQGWGKRAIRLGFRVVKGLGEKVARAIEASRAERAFSGLEDLRVRAHLAQNDVEALAEAGALERIVKTRRAALWKARSPRSGKLFEGHETEERPVSLPALRPAEQLLFDYARKGLSVDDHPMCHLRERLRHRHVITAAELQSAAQDRRVSVAGMVICRQQPGTASGVVFITLEDESGFANLVLWNRVFEQFRLVARHSAILLAHGKVERQPPGKDGAGDSPGAIVHLIVDGLERLDMPLPKMSRDFH